MNEAWTTTITNSSESGNRLQGKSSSRTQSFREKFPFFCFLFLMAANDESRKIFQFFFPQRSFPRWKRLVARRRRSSHVPNDPQLAEWTRWNWTWFFGDNPMIANFSFSLLLSSKFFRISFSCGSMDQWTIWEKKLNSFGFRNPIKILVFELNKSAFISCGGRAKSDEIALIYRIWRSLLFFQMFGYHINIKIRIQFKTFD